MKRKLKLISSIFSLTLAFTMMTFGVIAAVQRTVTVGGTLTFTSNSMAVSVAVWTSPASASAPATTGTTGYAAVSGKTAAFARGEGGEANVTKDITGIDFAYNETNIHSGILVRISNTDNSTINITKPAAVSSGNVHYTVTGPSTVAASGTADVYIIFTVQNPLSVVDFNNLTYTLNFVFSKGA